MENEIWKDVVGYEGLYKVSNKGNVLHLRKNKLLKPSIRGGYFRVWLFGKNTKMQCSIHRLVALSFIPNPQNKPQINHINAIKTDNSIENLEWCTHQENITHARCMGLVPKMVMSSTHKDALKKANATKIIDTSTKIIYNSITDAAKILGYKKSTLIHYLIGSRKNKTTLKYVRNYD